MNPRMWIIIGLVLMSAFVGLLALTPDVPAWLVAPFAVAFGIAVLGALLLDGSHRRLGAILVVIGGAFFFPLGAVVMVGARQQLDVLARQRFRDRRIQS